MSDTDLTQMRRRTFLKLLGASGVAVIVSPLQESLLAAPVEPMVPEVVGPKSGEVWIKFSDLNGSWMMLGDIIDFEMESTAEIADDPETLIPSYRGWRKVIAGPPSSRLRVRVGGVCSLDVRHRVGQICDFRFFLADRQFGARNYLVNDFSWHLPMGDQRFEISLSAYQAADDTTWSVEEFDGEAALS